MRLLYKPFGIVAGIAGGMLAKRVFAAVWERIDDTAPPPTAATEQATWQRVAAAAALQGAVFSGTRAVVDRAGARGFQHLFGVWPGKREPDEA